MSIIEGQRIKKPRGRPKKSDIALLIKQGLVSQCKIKCEICGRVFPRSKSLHAHVLTHNDVKKYKCSFPFCDKGFKQSSQLKNHVYLHSKELPFKCPADGCMVRYAHSHRICQFHPELKLIKQLETSEEIRSRFYQNVENLTTNAKYWFEDHLAERERKLRQGLVGREKNKTEDFQKINNHEKESYEEKNMQQQIQQNVQNKRTILNGEQLFCFFLEEVRRNGQNSRALFEKSCNSVIVQNLCNSQCGQQS